MIQLVKEAARTKINMVILIGRGVLRGQEGRSENPSCKLGGLTGKQHWHYFFLLSSPIISRISAKAFCTSGPPEVSRPIFSKFFISDRTWFWNDLSSFQAR